MSSWPAHAYDPPVPVFPHLLPNLFVSGVGFDIMTWCKENDIQAVLNVGGELAETYYSQPPPTTYLRLNVVDDPSFDIVPVLQETHSFLKKHQGEKVLVHCFWGQSRSVSVLLYHLMQEMGLSYCQALLEIRKNRPMADPKFAEILRTYNH